MKISPVASSVENVGQIDGPVYFREAFVEQQFVRILMDFVLGHLLHRKRSGARSMRRSEIL